MNTLQHAAAPADQEPLLRARGVGICFQGARQGWFGRRHEVRAVEDVDLDVWRGETLAIVGESGSGKTTLGRALARLLDPTSGSIEHAGGPAMPLSAIRRSIQVVYQDPFSALNPRMTVRELVEEPLIVHAIGDKPSRTARVAEMLGLVGLNPAWGDRFVHQFSGGQRQRIAVARALAIAPQILLADEPLSALDVSVQAQIINLLAELKQRLQLTLILISHDLSVVSHIADRVVVMYRGRIVEHGPVDAVFARPRHPYTRSLMAAIPVPDPFRRRPFVVQEDAADPPPGQRCAFSTRCPHAVELCTRQTPLLEPAQDGATQVACHRFRELEAPASTLHDFSPPYAARLARYVARRERHLTTPIPPTKGDRP